MNYRYLSKTVVRRLAAFALLILVVDFAIAQTTLTTAYLSLTLDNRGYITSMKNTSVTPNREFSPTDEPSPLLSLFNFEKKIYYYPQAAAYNATTHSVVLTYTNGCVATVTVNVINNKYIKLTLASLSPRKDVDDIQWGTIYTNITNLLGEVIGVAMDTSAAVNYAIGMLSLNNYTSAGPSIVDGDFGTGYLDIHAPDTSIKIPPPYYEGERLPIGGSCDVCFYGGVTPYVKFMNGFAGQLDSLGRVSFAYHSSDKRKNRTVAVAYRAFQTPVWGPADHIELQRIPGLDFVGSSVALYGCPQDIAITSVLENIVVTENLPHVTLSSNGSSGTKWVRDPARTAPGVTSSNYKIDSVISYTAQMGFNYIEVALGGFFFPYRSNNGVLSGTFNTTAGNLSYQSVCDLGIAQNVFVGLHTVTTSIPSSSSDVSPVPNDSLCCNFKRILAKGICSTDVNIEVTNPLYFNEIASWESNDLNLNMIKIGKELIQYNGVSSSPPYILQNVVRGYWGTAASAHQAGDTICKIEPTVSGGYDGISPNIFLLPQYGKYYGNIAANTHMRFFDFDGSEFLFNTGHGQYAIKSFYEAMKEQAAAAGIPVVRFSAAGFTEGSYLYQPVANYGSGGNVINFSTRQLQPQGIAMTNTAVSNFFPASFSGSVGSIDANSTVQTFENFEAYSVGLSASYSLALNADAVESCPVKYQIFSAVKTWETARAANAFSTSVKRMLRDITQSWHLVQVDNNDWNLYPVVNGVLGTAIPLTRDTTDGY
jgi:hypothetical protein